MNTVYPLKTLSQLRPLLIGFRKANGLTQKDVSERLGVTQQTYARLEANPGSASMGRLFKVLTVLGVDVVLASGPSGLFCASSSTMEGAEKPIDSPTRREKW
ncbi:helix-turn-helix transcriptional regulator [Acerihabitans sp. TG2]|uniref:helix-turn-helix transcriptional regulator n=1 Tax=Acerihabitans sp. TG2 TaxID=3096008 RepID=UPI002B22E460|nr:helix-turn-helix transcriptional regulator [Acerihabitans sp. TG2]MEA9393413.1 helix-turn-helix transcriptional regulator [Acerihabitans sp. TG2]